MWHEGEQTGWWLLIDIAAVVPVVGALKYSDEFETFVKRAEWKKIWKDISDSCSGDLEKIRDNFKELWENGSKKLSDFGEDIQTWWKKGDQKAAKEAAESNETFLTEVLEGGTDFIELSKSNIQHIKKHTFDGMSEQAKYLTDEQLANKLANTTF